MSEHGERGKRQERPARAPGAGRMFEGAGDSTGVSRDSGLVRGGIGIGVSDPPRGDRPPRWIPHRPMEFSGGCQVQFTGRQLREGGGPIMNPADRTEVPP